jgi:hypothetical protein|nr:MAG TPA: hypothetical protein [Caudoviricetes sp.]
MSLLDLATDSEDYVEEVEKHPSVENIPEEQPEKINTDISENRDNAEAVKTLLDVVESLENFKDNLKLMQEEEVVLDHESLNLFNQRVTMAFNKGNMEAPLPLHLSRESFRNTFGQAAYNLMIERLEEINRKLVEKLN